MIGGRGMNNELQIKRGQTIRQPQYISMFGVLKPGKWKITRYEDWKDISFGYCPACGVLGREQLPSSDSPDAWFDCADESCYTHFCLEIPARLTGDRERAVWNSESNGIRPTGWSDKKPEWWLKIQRERGTYSWNWERFSSEYCVEHDLV